MPQVLKRTPKKYQDPPLWAWLEKCFIIKRHERGAQAWGMIERTENENVSKIGETARKM